MNIKKIFIVVLFSLACFPLSILAEDWESIFHPNQKAYENFLKELEKRDISLDAFLDGTLIKSDDLVGLIFGRSDEGRYSMLAAIDELHWAHVHMVSTIENQSLHNGLVLIEPKQTLDLANRSREDSMNCFKHACLRYQYLEDYAMKYCPENVAAVREEFEYYRYYFTKYDHYLHTLVPILIEHCARERELYRQQLEGSINIITKGY